MFGGVSKMQIQEFPKALQMLLVGMDCEINNIGRSTAGVYKYYNSKISYYLKIQPILHGLHREYEIMKWLDEKLPVPRMVYFNSYKGFEYLLMTEIKGEILCSECFLNNPEKAVKLLANGIKILQTIPIETCVFDNSLEIKLKEALYNIENNLVDMDDWEKVNRFDSPMELLKYLENNKPKELELSFTHGDYCLPNILADGDKVNGFIDLGRGGIGDIYQDVALCVRSLKHNFSTDDYTDLFFKYLEMEPNWEKVDYYILLDELF